MREVVMNKKTNLLQLEEHFYQLADVKEPNVFHNLFPYDEIPKIAFNDRIVPHNMPENIWITDTTFRDGQQSRFTNAWNVVINFRKLPAGSVQANRISS